MVTEDDNNSNSLRLPAHDELSMGRCDAGHMLQNASHLSRVSTGAQCSNLTCATLLEAGIVKCDCGDL